MIHEIEPHVFKNEFKVCNPKSTDFVVRYDGTKTLLKKVASGQNSVTAASYAIPRVGELLAFESKTLADFKGHYLFSIDDTAFFMDDDYAPPEGTEGTVLFVDDIGSIHVQWDSGSSLAVAFGMDRCTVIK